MRHRFEDTDHLDIRCDAHEADDSYDGEPCERCFELIDQARVEAEEVAASLEAASGAIRWAESVTVVVSPRPGDESLRAEADAYYRSRGFDSPPGKTGLHAFVRHNYTNYDDLLRAMEDDFPSVRGGDAYVALRQRVDMAVDDALFDALLRETGCEGEDETAAVEGAPGSV